MSNWVLFFLDKINARRQPSYDGIEWAEYILSRNAMALSKYDEKFPGFVVSYAEEWIENNYLYQNSYATYFLDSFENIRKLYCETIEYY